MGLLDNILKLKDLAPNVAIKEVDMGQSQSQPFVNLEGIQPQEMKVAFDLQRTGVQGRPQYPSTDIESLQGAYTRSEIAYAAIQAKVTAAIDPRLMVQLRTSQGEWEEEAGHPLRRLIMEPNEDQDEAEFAGEAIASRDISGRFYAEIVRSKFTGLPEAMHPLNPAKIAPIPGDKGIVGYEFKDGNRKVTIPAEDMIAWIKQSPTDKYQGLSPLAVCLGAVDADNAQTDFIRAFFNNGGVPSGILKMLNRSLTPAEAAVLRAQWDASRSRAFGNQQTTAVLDQNADYVRIGSNLDELQGSSLREFTETRVAMVFGVPPFIIYSFAGIQHNTYSNAEEAWKQFWASTMTPWFKSWRTFLTRRLLPEFVSRDLILAERIRLNWDMSQVSALQEDLDKIQARARENFSSGAWTLNELRATTGKQPDPQGDYYLRLFNHIPQPFGEASEVLVGDTTAADEEAPKRSAIHALREVKAKVGRATIERRMERDVRALIMKDYAGVAGRLAA